MVFCLSKAMHNRHIIQSQQLKYIKYVGILFNIKEYSLKIE